MKRNHLLLFLLVAILLTNGCNSEQSGQSNENTGSANITGLDTQFRAHLVDPSGKNLSHVMIVRVNTSNPPKKDTLGWTGSAGSLISNGIQNGDTVEFSREDYRAVKIKLVNAAQINELEIVLKPASSAGSTQLHAKGKVKRTTGQGWENLEISDGVEGSAIRATTDAYGEFFLSYGKSGPAILQYGGNTSLKAALKLLAPVNDTVSINVHLNEKDNQSADGSAPSQR